MIMEQKLRISQCMIVKNEEKNIARALTWGKDLMWEQIVVDTGSTDRTRELAERLGARLYLCPWTDDFSAAKNYALEQAGGDWIAFLDADEYLTPEDAARLPALLTECECRGMDMIAASMVNIDETGRAWGTGTLTRFFRNDPGLRYERRIHEQLRFKDGRAMRTGDAGTRLTIYHTGYSGRAYEEKRASGRNRRLIERELSEHPDSYEMMGYLGDEYGSGGDWRKAGEWYEKAIAEMPEQLPPDDQRSAVTIGRMMDILTRENRGEELAILYRKAAGLFPEEGDYDWMLSRYLTQQGDYAGGERCILQALDKLNRFGCSGHSMILASNLEGLYENLAHCQYHQGKLKEAVQTAAAFLKENPYNLKLLYILLQCFRQEKIPPGRESAYAAQAAAFLERFYCFSSLKDKLFLRKAAGLAGYEELVRMVDSRMNEAEQAALRQHDREGS